MTPFYLLILGLIVGLFCAMIEILPTNGPKTTAIAKLVKIWSYIMFAVGLFLYLSK